VISASATSRTAPFVEFVEPFRGRAAAMTGAPVEVDTIAISAFTFHPGVAASGALLGIPVGLAHGVIDIHVGSIAKPGRGQPGVEGQVAGRRDGRRRGLDR
jgi:hypothetical protein